MFSNKKKNKKMIRFFNIILKIMKIASNVWLNKMKK